jgi:predicted ribosome quality control (RQC) complex YloA/Tae2 family protein
MGFCNNERAHHHFACVMRTANIIKNLPNTNIEYQAERFRSFLSNSHSAIQLKLLAMRFFQYQGLQHNIVTHVAFIVDKLFDPEQRRPFQDESRALEILRNVSSQNIGRRIRIRMQRINFNRETEHYRRMVEEYNAVRTTYTEQVREYNNILRENLATEIETIRRHATHIPNGANILAQMNAGLETSRTAAERNTIVGHAMVAIQSAIEMRDREIEQAERERVRLEGRQQQNPFTINVSIFCTESADELQQHCECPICYGDEVKCIQMVETGCNHQFCGYCISRHIDQPRPDNKKACCPLCRTEISSLVVKDVELHQELVSNLGYT